MGLDARPAEGATFDSFPINDICGYHGREHFEQNISECSQLQCVNGLPGHVSTLLPVFGVFFSVVAPAAASETVRVLCDPTLVAKPVKLTQREHHEYDDANTKRTNALLLSRYFFGAHLEGAGLCHTLILARRLSVKRGTESLRKGAGC